MQMLTLLVVGHSEKSFVQTSVLINHLKNIPEANYRNS